MEGVGEVGSGKTALMVISEENGILRADIRVYSEEDGKLVEERSFQDLKTVIIDDSIIISRGVTSKKCYFTLKDLFDLMLKEKELRVITKRGE